MNDPANMASFYEGIIDYRGADPNYEGIAEAVNFLRANEVMIDIGKARIENGSARFRFIVKEPDQLLLKAGDGKQSLAMLKALFDGCSISYRKADPTAQKASLLKACTRLSSMTALEERVDAEDFRCHAAGPRDADPFDNLVGMADQKRVINEIAAAVAKYGRTVLTSCHMAFVGNPGTGKTELARCLLHRFDRTGVTDGRGTFVKADAADLIGRYVGETPRLVRNKVLQADGGLLFIDEAYRLAETGRGGNAFAHEAVNTLVEMMESRRERFVCVLAGYPHSMEDLFSMNAGLRDRVGFRIAFSDYSASELRDIFEQFARAKGFVVSSEARHLVEQTCARLARQQGFANARSVRRLFERCVIKQSCRPGCGRTLERQDVAAAAADGDVGDAGRPQPIGFTA